MTLPTYNTGTVGVANGGTTVTGVGTVWSGVNVREGDFFARADGVAVVTEVTDTTHLQITPWPGATVASGGAYTIHQNFVGRVVGVAAAEDVATLIALLGTTPSLSNDQTFSGKQAFSNTTEATGAGTTAAILISGGVEIAKKLFVAGAVALASTLAVTGTSVLTGGVQVGSTASQYTAKISARVNGNAIEFGHTNTAGYGSTLGASTSDGYPWLLFNASAGTTANTFKTWGVKGSLFRSDLLGGFYWGSIATASADNQTPTGLMALSSAGALTVTGAVSFASTLAVAGTLTTATLDVSGNSSLTGYVGIGLAATSSAKLYVKGTGATSATNAFIVVNSASTVLLQLKNDGAFSVPVMVSVGGVAVTADKLQVVSDASAVTSLGLYQSGIAQWAIGMSSGSDVFRFATSGVPGTGTDRLTISFAGVVTVPATTTSSGTTSGALVVNGGVGIAGNLRVGLYGGAAVFGAGTGNASVIFNGGTGTAVGAYFGFQRNSAADWFFGHKAAVTGSGSSTNLIAFMSAAGTALELDASTLNIIGGANIIFSPPASATPASNGQLTFQATSNTSLTFKYKGSDGTVRSGSVTLA